jgi:hypothetical protein
VCQPRQKRLLAPAWIVKPFHREQLPLDGIVGLIEQGARHRHLGGFEHRIPARFFALELLSYALAIGRSGRSGDVSRKATQSLPECKHAQAFALSRPVEQGVEL